MINYRSYKGFESQKNNYRQNTFYNKNNNSNRIIQKHYPNYDNYTHSYNEKYNKSFYENKPISNLNFFNSFDKCIFHQSKIINANDKQLKNFNLDLTNKYNIPALSRVSTNINDSIVKLKGFVNTLPVHILLDTGASISGMSLDVYNK